jgi:hypothetical protein
MLQRRQATRLPYKFSPDGDGNVRDREDSGSP